MEVIGWNGLKESSTMLFYRKFMDWLGIVNLHADRALDRVRNEAIPGMEYFPVDLSELTIEQVNGLAREAWKAANAFYHVRDAAIKNLSSRGWDDARFDRELEERQAKEKGKA